MESRNSPESESVTPAEAQSAGPTVAALLKLYGLEVSPASVKDEHHTHARGDVRLLYTTRRYGNRILGRVIVGFGLAVLPLVIYMPCIVGVSLCSVIIGGAIALGAEPGGYALVLRTRRGVEFELARHADRAPIERLRLHIADTLKLSSPG